MHSAIPRVIEMKFFISLKFMSLKKVMLYLLARIIITRDFFSG